MPNSAGVEVARISVKVSPDTKQFRRELKRDLDAIEKALRGQVDMKPDTDGFRENLQAKVDAAARGVRGKVMVDSEVDEKKTKDQANKVAAIFGKGGGGIDFPFIGGGGNASGWATLLAAVTALAAPVIGTITTALLALPGLIAAIATPIAAVMLGLDGVKKAAEVLKQPFGELKQIMATAFQDGLVPAFEQLRNIFPTLKSALPSIASGMSDVAKSIADILTSPENLKVIENTIRNIGAGISASAPGIASFVNSLLLLVEGFSKKLPDLGAWITKSGNGFLDWVKKITHVDWTTGTSQFDRALSGLGDVLKTVLNLVTELGKEGLDFMSDPEKVEGFVNLLTQIKDLLVQIMDLSSQLSQQNLFSNLIPSFDMEKVKQDLLTPFTSMDAPWRSMWAGIQQTALDAFGGMGLAAGTAASTIQSAFANVGSAISNIWSGVVAAAQGAWNGVVSAVQSAWGQIVSAVQQGVSNVLSAVGQLPGQIQAFFADAGSWLVSAGKAIIQGLINGIKSMVGAVKDAVGSVLGSIKNLIPHSPAKEGPFSGAGWKEVAAGGAALATQFGDGFESGFQSVLERAKTLAGELKKAMDTGADESSILGDMNPKDLKLYLDALEQEKKRIKIQKNDLPKDDKAGRAALQNQLDQLQAQKDILSYQKDRVKNEAQYGDAAGDDPFVKAASGLMNAPIDFAKATGKQFMEDLGISGNGFISKAITEGISYVFNIGSVDEALSIKDRQDSKQAMTIAGSR